MSWKRSVQIFFGFLMKNENQEDLWNEGISSIIRFYFILFFFYSFVSAMRRNTRLLPADTRGSEIAMKKIQRISQTIMVSLWNVSYMKDAGHTHTYTWLCISRRHAYVINIFLITRARARVTLCNVNLAVVSNDC